MLPGQSQPTDLDAMLLQQRRIMTAGSLDSAEVNRISALLMTLDGLAAEPIELVVNSTGGAVADVLGVVDIMALLRAPLNVVATRAQGTAAAVVGMASGTREASQHATFSLRLPDPVVVAAALNAEQLGSLAEAHLQQLDTLAEMLSNRTGHAAQTFLDEFRGGATHAAAHALELGIIDTIRGAP